MEDLSLHMLDIAENAVRAGGTTIVLTLIEDLDNDMLTITIEDDGAGMDAETVEKVLDPFYTTKDGKEVGLGLALLSQAAQQAGGKMTVESRKGKGTKVTAEFQLSHPDRQPVGDVLGTVGALVVGNPLLRFVLDYKKGAMDYHFDSQGNEGQ